MIALPQIFDTEQWVPVPLERVFRFFADPRNLSVISPPSSGAKLKRLQLVTPDLKVEGAKEMAGVGSEIEISVRLLPYVPVRASWIARITEFDWLHHFRDVQASGPFTRFDHTHTFVAERVGTTIRDHVEYDIGYGPFGPTLNKTLVRSMLHRMFDYRHKATEKALKT